jgi:hypothetical protein
VIVQKLIASLEPRLSLLTVKKVVIGLRYTCVVLSDGSCGLAATLDEGECCNKFNWSGPLAGRPALELARGLATADSIGSSIGLATVNAVLSKDAPLQEIEPIELLEIDKDDVVGMIGNIAPLARHIAERAKELLIFERNPSQRSENVLPDWAVEWELPRCKAVFITGSAFINKTIDHLLELCKGNVVIIGPTTPLWPKLFNPSFKPRPVNGLFGVRVCDPELVYQIISEGGSTHALLKHAVVRTAFIS